MVGGDIEGRRTSDRLPGEHTGAAIGGGHSYELEAGDMLNIPPSTPHQVTPGAEGITYMLMKLNVGMYPWRLVAGLQQWANRRLGPRDRLAHVGNRCREAE